MLKPPIWLMILIVGLGQLSETAYSPSLPAIAHALQASPSMVEYTLTIYLFGFAIGTFFWGRQSDKNGRKPCMIIGLGFFILGSLGCYLSTNIAFLMASRLIQAFGGSVGSVLGQSICRDAFKGPELGRAYSIIGSAMTVFPAIGPIIGGFIAEHYDWPYVFLFLIACASILLSLITIKLPETHPKSRRNSITFLEVFRKFICDKRILSFGFIVGACNGISFSFFGEGSFYLIKLLGLSHSQYGLCFSIISIATFAGGMVSRQLQQYRSSDAIMRYGIWIMLGSTIIFTSLILTHDFCLNLPNSWLIAITILSQMAIMFGFCIVISNALALALVDYKGSIGTASSLFGFYYYLLISFFTLGMGSLHNGTLLPMPLYFLSIAALMMIVDKCFLQHD